MEQKTIADRFSSASYLEFKNIVSKAASDNSIKVKNNYVVYGKKKVKIPNFKSLDSALQLLNAEKVDLLRKYNDLYETIIISNTPEIYQNAYNNVINRIHSIDNLVDEIVAYLDERNTETIYKPLAIFTEEINNNRQVADNIIGFSSDNVHIEKQALKELVKIHKQYAILEAKIQDTLELPAMKYVIWEDEDTKKPIKIERSLLSVEQSAKVSSAKPSQASKSKPLTKKATIQKKAKKALLQEFDF